MSGWKASSKFCRFLRSSHWPMTKQLSAPKAVGHLGNVKVTDAELKESKKLKHLHNMLGMLSSRNCSRS